MTQSTRPTDGRADAARPYPLTVYYDGDCPICAREIALLARLNRRQRLRFVDFAAPTYDPGRTGLGREELGRVIHARWADGSILVGVEVFRELWSAVGLGTLARLSRLPGIDRLVTRAYAWFARNRHRLTGRGASGDRRRDVPGRNDAGTCPRCRAHGEGG